MYYLIYENAECSDLSSVEGWAMDSDLASTLVSDGWVQDEDDPSRLTGPHGERVRIIEIENS